MDNWKWVEKRKRDSKEPQQVKWSYQALWAVAKSPRSNNDTSRLGFTSIEEGETSKSAKQRSDKGKNSKPTC